MPVRSVEIGRKYLMEDGRVLLVDRLWDAEDGHQRVGCTLVEGAPDGLLDAAVKDFAAEAIREI